MKTFFEEMVVEVTEDLKLVEDDEWDDLYEEIDGAKLNYENSKQRFVN